MRNLLKRAKRLFYSAERKKREFALAAQRFASEYPDSFVLLADPDTDLLFASYRGIAAPVRMSQPDGSRMHIVSNALNYSKVEKSVDQFLLVVDSQLFNISKELDTKRRKVLKPEEVDAIAYGPEEEREPVKSPIQQEDI